MRPAGPPIIARVTEIFIADSPSTPRGPKDGRANTLRVSLLHSGRRCALQNAQNERNGAIDACSRCDGTKSHHRRPNEEFTMAERRKVIITCAITGSIHTPSMSPHLPVTPKQIADAAVAAAEAGAAIVHLHARDPVDGHPTQDPKYFREF